MKLSRLVKQPEKHYRLKSQEYDSVPGGADRTGMLVPCKRKAAGYSPSGGEETRCRCGVKRGTTA